MEVAFSCLEAASGTDGVHACGSDSAGGNATGGLGADRVTAGEAQGAGLAAAADTL